MKFNVVVFHFLISFFLFFPASRYTDRLIRALLASCTREPEVGSCCQRAWRHDGTRAFQTLSLAYSVITAKTQNYISKQDTLFTSCHCICANNTFKLSIYSQTLNVVGIHSDFLQIFHNLHS